jgi:hypothetical protein
MPPRTLLTRGKAAGRESGHHLAAVAVVADHGDLLVVEFRRPVRDVTHGDEHRAGDQTMATFAGGSRGGRGSARGEAVAGVAGEM